MSAPVVIYTTRSCGYCTAAKRFLSTVKKVEYEEIDVSDDPKGRQTLVERSGRMTVPQIWVGEKHVGGYDDLRALDAEGKLDPLLLGPTR